MEKSHDLILTRLRDCRETLVEIALQGVERNPEQTVVDFPREALGQMVDGTLTAMEEFFGEGDRPFWHVYMSAVIPGIVSSGASVAQVVQTVAGFFMQSAVELDRVLEGDPRRDEASREFARFGSEWIAAIAEVEADS